MSKCTLWRVPSEDLSASASMQFDQSLPPSEVDLDPRLSKKYPTKTED